MRGKIYVLTKDSYEEKTGLKYPYYQKGSYYAVRPYCDNPIRINGLKTENPKREIYGSHAGVDVPGLAKNHVETMKECDAFVGGRLNKYNQHLYKVSDKPVKEILAFIRKNYDVILKVIESETGMHITNKQAKVLLKRYMSQNAWAFFDTRPNNIPWILLDAYGGMNVDDVLIKKGSKAYNFLSSLDDVSFSDSDYVENYAFVHCKAQYIFLFHKIVFNREKQIEEMLFDIMQLYPEHPDNNKRLARYNMQLDINKFVELCESRKNTNSKRLEIAEELIPDCIFLE